MRECSGVVKLTEQRNLPVGCEITDGERTERKIFLFFLFFFLLRFISCCETKGAANVRTQRAVGDRDLDFPEGLTF